MENIKKIFFIFIFMLVCFSSQAVILPGTDEYKEAYLEHYVNVSELIVIGKIYKKGMGTYIKVKNVLKGDKQLENKEITIYELKPGMDITCGVGKPEIPQANGKAVAMFGYDKFNLDNSPFFITSYTKQKRIQKIKILLNEPRSIK